MPTGKYGIYGHYLGDLDLVGVEPLKDRTFYELSVDS
jgi:hypothetical protein